MSPWIHSINDYAGSLPGLYDLAAHGTTRWDLLLVLAAMAVTKLSFMLYFRLRD